MTSPALVDRIEQYLPGWMRLDAYSHWLRLALSIAYVTDCLVEGLYQGRKAGAPGQVAGPGILGLGGFDSIDALPKIGRDRGIPRGFTEPAEDYARRLRQWRKAWKQAGIAVGLLTQLRGILGPNPPRVRLVSRHGVWDTFEADGTYIHNTPTGAGGFRINPDGSTAAEPDPAHPWDWDTDQPETWWDPDEQEIAEIWPIIYAPTNEPLTGDDGLFAEDSVYDPETNLTLGTTSTLQHVDLVRGLMGAWKAGGVICRWMIVAFDPDSFDPLTAGPYPAAGMPDGSWGSFGHLDGGVWVPSRLDSARYWEGPN